MTTGRSGSPNEIGRPGARLSTSWWHRQPIERKLPLAFAALVAVVSAFYIGALYREVERSTSEAVLTRLTSVSEEVAQILGSTHGRRIAAVKRMVDSTSPERKLTPAPTDSATTLLLDTDGNVTAVRGMPPSDVDLRELGTELAGVRALPARGAVGRLFREDGNVYYWTVAATGAPGRETGFVAQRRQISNSNSRSSEALKSLIGETTVLLANAGDYSGPWLQLEGPEVQVAERPSESAPDEYVRGGEVYATRMTRVPSSTWVVITETPRAVIKARASAFAYRILPFTFAFVLLGGLLAWFFGKRITRPIRDLAAAATGIGSGDYHRRVAVRQGGDLGNMARAFNRMATEVENSRKELDHRVRQRTAELEIVNTELQSFSYSVSHDLRSPLRSIDGFSQALLEDYNDQLDTTAQDYLRRIRGGAQRMGMLIDDLLMLSRVARQPIERHPVDASALANEVVAELRESDRDRQVDVVVEDGLTINADRGLLHVALQNLIGNAWKFTSQTGAPRIEVGRTEKDGAEAVFVRDNGAGFDMAYAHHLFAPFQRLHSTKQFTGTGIGLATVQRVVNRHGGRVWAESVPGNGATFYFTVDQGNDVDSLDSAG